MRWASRSARLGSSGCRHIRELDGGLSQGRLRESPATNSEPLVLCTRFNSLATIRVLRIRWLMALAATPVPQHHGPRRRIR